MHELPVQTREIKKNKESESTISDIEDYMNKKFDKLAMPRLKKGTITRSALVSQKRGKQHQVFKKSK